MPHKHQMHHSSPALRPPQEHRLPALGPIATVPIATVLIVLFLTAMAAGLRLYQLGSLPAGLHHDEASNGMLALHILDGHVPVFFSSYTGKEAGYMYLVALAIKLCGQTIFAIRAPAAIVGSLLVPAIFLAARQLLASYRYAQSVALLAAGGTAIAPWLLHINRIGFRGSLLPLTLTLWVWLLMKALQWREGRYWGIWGGAGVMLGLTAYTYTSSRIVPLLVAGLGIYLALWHRHLWRQHWRGIAMMVIVAGVVATPLFAHYLAHPDDWGERLEQIGACHNLAAADCARRLLSHTVATIGQVGIRGDALGFFNVPHHPALPPFAGWLFYIGVAMAIRRSRELPMALLLLWWITLAIPAILSRDSPHFLRSIGAAPPTMILWALPVAVALQRLERFAIWQSSWRQMAVTGGIGGLLLLAMGGWSGYDYFVRWAQRPSLYYEYMGYATDAAHDLQSLPDAVDLYLSEEYYRHPTYLYLAPRTASAHWFDARFGVPLARPGHPTIYLISPSTPTDARVGEAIAGAQGENVLTSEGQYAYTRFDLPQGRLSTPAPHTPLDIHIGEAHITGITVERNRQTPPHPLATLNVTLFFHITDPSPSPRQVRVFLHLVDANGDIIAQHDTIGYPSPEWRADDRFLNLHTLTVPDGVEGVEGVEIETCSLVWGLYDIATGERYAVGGETGEYAVTMGGEELLEGEPDEPIDDGFR